MKGTTKTEITEVYGVIRQTSADQKKGTPCKVLKSKRTPTGTKHLVELAAADSPHLWLPGDRIDLLPIGKGAAQFSAAQITDHLAKIGRSLRRGEKSGVRLAVYTAALSSISLVVGLTKSLPGFLI